MTAARHASPPAASHERVICGNCQRYIPLSDAIARFDRWFCDDACVLAWEKERARPARPVLAAAITLAVLAALAAQARQGANITVPWHYPCAEHVARWGRLAVEWFTPASDFRKGLCLQ